MKIKVTAKETWKKGMIDSVQTENGKKTIMITTGDLRKIAEKKMREDISTGYQWSVTFSSFKFEFEVEEK